MAPAMDERWPWRRSARSACASAISRARKTRCTARSTSAVIFNSTRRQEPSSIRGRYEVASEFLGRAGEAYGAYGRQTSQWYEWSVKVLGARLALRQGFDEDALTRANEILAAEAPPFDALQATLIAAEAL